MEEENNIRVNEEIERLSKIIEDQSSTIVQYEKFMQFQEETNQQMKTS